VDGVLVEKAMGYRESLLACALIEALRAFVQPRKLGLVAGEQGMMRLARGLVRIPDVSFVSWERIPERRVPEQPIAGFAPDLAVEVVSPSNSPAEMERKLSEYFQAGTRLVWFVDPDSRCVEVYTTPNDCMRLSTSDNLDGAAVLPGFALSLRDLFAELDEQAPPGQQSP
jgi:Uma2 family endonuclease